MALGHDVAQDLYNNGADVTLIQRSSTLLVSSKNFFEISGALYSEVGPPVEVRLSLRSHRPAAHFFPYSGSRSRVRVVSSECIQAVRCCHAQSGQRR